MTLWRSKGNCGRRTHLEAPAGIVLVHISVEEPCGLGGIVEHVLGRLALGLANVPDLVVLRAARVQRQAEEQFGDHTAQGPHVDRLAERQTWPGWEGDVSVRGVRRSTVAVTGVKTGYCSADKRQEEHEVESFEHRSGHVVSKVMTTDMIAVFGYLQVYRIRQTTCYFRRHDAEIVLSQLTADMISRPAPKQSFLSHSR